VRDQWRYLVSLVVGELQQTDPADDDAGALPT
jgi:hypothetical protein